MHKIIATGSTGNCVMYAGIMVDIGVPYSKIEPYINDIQIVLLSHVHQDHINISTLKRLQFEKPGIRIGCGKHMMNLLDGLRNIDVFEVGQVYDYGLFKISPVRLYHDVENIGFRLFFGDFKVFHATDTSHLIGITAKDYDIYGLEHNYNHEKAMKIIADYRAQGKFCHLEGSMNSHLSEEQAGDFLYKNAKPDSIILRLHESQTAI